jgi:hypothetical protein
MTVGRCVGNAGGLLVAAETVTGDYAERAESARIQAAR